MELTSPEILSQIIEKNNNIAVIRLFMPTMSPPIQEDSALSSAEKELVEEALYFREATKLPFWDCLLHKISNSRNLTPNLLRRALRHNPQEDTIEEFEKRDISAAFLFEKMRNLPQGKVLAISSRMTCIDGSEMHLPMLDFHCSVSNENNTRVKAIIASLGVKGFIAHSGQSYHFYGSHLISPRHLFDMLARALLLAPIIDRAWIGHQLIEGACGLRISPGKTYSKPPIIFEQIA